MLSPSMKIFLMYLLVERVLRQKKVICIIIAHLLLNKPKRRVRQRVAPIRYGMISRMPDQVFHLNRLYKLTDSDCINNLRMDRNTFATLCFLLRELGGLRDHRYMGVEEQVSMFLSVLAHHKKQSIIKFDYLRSGQTVSHYVNVVLKALLKLHYLFLVEPTPVPDDSVDPRWKWFKGCLGALDGTYLHVQVGASDKGRFRSRKGGISTNCLGVCNPDLKFIYFLCGWEGSAADSRVLRDDVTRPNGLKVPKGNYYLCDNGYANSEGFLAPYRGCRYHLKDWGPANNRPSNHTEHFNMRHTRARNVIERAFGVLKKRWGILSSPSFYPLKTQIRLIMACFLLHNFIRTEMDVDPIEQELDDEFVDDEDSQPSYVIDTVESSPMFNQWRDDLSISMYQMWRSHG